MRVTVRIALTCCLAVAVASPPAQGQPPSKLDARARLALAQLTAGAAPRELRARLEPVTEDGRLDVFIEGDVTREELEAAGVEVRTAFAGLYTAFVPRSAVGFVEALAGVERIEGAAILESQLDQSVPWTGAIQLRQGAAGVPGLDGRGVIVGIVDGGIAWNHPAFRDAANQSRILSIWDQTVIPANAPPDRFGLTYGQECRGPNPTCGPDLCGHGTHVAGIAAGDGDGNAGPTPWVGVAPGASLVVVKTTFGFTSERSNMTSTGVVDAVSYVFQVAADLDMPAVVNLSLGTHYGPHDGTSPFERMLDSLSGVGRIIVVSAGNERDDDVHAQLGGFRGFVATVEVLGGAVPGAAVVIDGYYPGTDNYNLTITGPDGVAPIGPIMRGGQTSPYPGERTWSNIWGISRGWVYAENGFATSRCGARQVYVVLSRQFPGETISGTWTLQFDPVLTNSEFDLWVAFTNPPGVSAKFMAGLENEQHLIGEPGNARRVITVASWTTRTEWPDCNGGPFFGPGLVGSVSSFSSPGPTRDGREKPDIAAPGETIVSTWVDAQDPTCGTTPLGCGSLPRPAPHAYAAISGTSMAAPHVTGAVALLQQEFGAISPECTKFYLKRMAQFDLEPVQWWQPRQQWTRYAGWGRLDLGALVAPGGIGALPTDLLQDAFPANETYGLVTTAAFDTTSALVKTGFNTAQPTLNQWRHNVPGDSMLAIAGGRNVRVDLVFRVKPGPGNYVQMGNPASGLRRVPTSTAAVTTGDGSFWSVYRDLPGEFSSTNSATLHAAAPGQWDRNVWNSARMDTAEVNLFPIAGCVVADAGPHAGLWSATYHEADDRRPILGIPKHRCFVVDTTRGPTGANVACNQVPTWLTVVPPSRSGFDGEAMTREYTKIIPDGLLTPGSHVEYFFRKYDITAGLVTMCPDTTRVFPQPCIASRDGARWEQFSVLPDAWKRVQYGGYGMACMLYVDLDDGSGGERVWQGVADSLGATMPDRYGAGTGWHAIGAGADVNLPQNNRVAGAPGFTSAHLGQPGTTWDRYNVRGGSLLFGYAGSLGSRLSWRGNAGLTTEKWSRQAPTPEMLRELYGVVMLHSGDRDEDILGPFVDYSQDDVAMLRDFLWRAHPGNPRGILVEGSGFVAAAADQGPPQSTFCSDMLGVGLRDDSYEWLAGWGPSPRAPDLIIGNAVNARPDVFGVHSPTPVAWPSGLGFSRSGNDVLVPEAAAGVAAASWYENVGFNGPYVASVHKAPVGANGEWWTALTNGWNPVRVLGRDGGTSYGRLAYYYAALENVFGPQCWLVGTPAVTLDAPPERSVASPRDMLELRGANPVRAGATRFAFGTRRPGRVVIAVHDLAGREIRRLVDARFEPGAYECTWDGRSALGTRVAGGIYFVRMRRDELEMTRKVVMIAR